MIAGIDEVGIGCIAGPMVMSAVIVDDKVVFPENVRDSKSLSQKQVDELFCPITELANKCIVKIAYPSFINTEGGIWAAWSHVIDELIEECDGMSLIIVDGVRVTNSRKDVLYEPRADQKYKVVSAASIISKKYQVDYMLEADKRYPSYGFASHKGYATEKHRNAVRIHGPSPVHRLNNGPVQRAAKFSEKRTERFCRKPTCKTIIFEKSK